MKCIERWLPGVILTTYVVLAVGYSLADPLYESTDELRHVRYVRHIVAYRDLPVQRPSGPRAQSHHPPLYYVLGALASCWVPVEDDVYYQPPENPFWAYRYWEVGNDNKTQYVHGPSEKFPFQGITLAVYVVRWMTVLIGAGVVWITYLIGQKVFPKWPALALGGSALVAFNPQFLYLSGAVNNDVPAALCGAVVLLLCVQIVRKGPRPRTDALLGVLFGLALLTKLHLIVLLIPIELAYLLAVRQDRDWGVFLRANLLILGLTAAISGWWFWRNQTLYGDLLGVSAHSELWGSRPPSQGWWAIRQELPYLWSTLWGRFGHGQVALPRGVYRGTLGFCALALAGYLVPRDRAHSRASLAILTTTIFVFSAWVFYYTLVQPAGARGRFLFPCLPAFTLLLMGGLRGLLPRYHGWGASLLATAAMLALAVYALVAVLAPAFAPPQPLGRAEIEAIPNAMSIDFGPTAGNPGQAVARLLGYHVTPAELDPGDTVTVTLYWKALARTERPHAVFIHVLSDEGTMIAQRDTYPGLGRYPTVAWNPGTVFADAYRVHLPETAYAPDTGYVQVGLYVPEGPRLATDNGRDALQLARIRVRPRAGDVPNPLNVNFGDKVALIGYALDQRVAHPGETIRLTLYWRAVSSMDVNYEVFVHVLGKENQVWANSDSPLTDEAVCTNRWDIGKAVKEVRELTIVEATPPDFYDIELGLHASGQGRLKILAADGRQLGNRTLLTRIRVVNGE
ncbi:MAG: glycosyltransferase family 39 protein [Anaerolineae bacterium]